MKRAHDELVRNAAEGDRVAIDELVGRHLPALRAYIRMRMGPRVRRWETDSDIAQSVCLEALGGLESIEDRGEAAFRHWLFTIGRRKLARRDQHLTVAKRDVDLIESRATTSRPDPLDAEIQRAFGSPSEMAIERETVARIEEAMDTLDEETREIILLSRLAGLGSQEIAERLDRNASSVRVTLSRGLAAIARVLDAP